MRHLIVFFALIAISGTALPQVYFPLHVGDTWVYKAQTLVNCEGTSIVYQIWGDTVINAQSYARFSNYSPFSGPLVRSDSIRVYEYDTATHTEYVVFDFSAKPGDTVSVRNNGTKFTIALGSMQFAVGSTRYTIRDSVGVISWYDAAFLCAFDLNGAWIDGKQIYTEVLSNNKQFPGEPLLEQNYPNPFNPETTIRLFLPGEQSVSLGIYNSLGQQVEVLFDGRMSAGWHLIDWAAQYHSSGIYFCRLTTGHSTLTRSLVLLR